jgi:hypothetical protein
MPHVLELINMSKVKCSEGNSASLFKKAEYKNALINYV